MNHCFIFFQGTKRALDCKRLTWRWTRVFFFFFFSWQEHHRAFVNKSQDADSLGAVSAEKSIIIFLNMVNWRIAQENKEQVAAAARRAEGLVWGQRALAACHVFPHITLALGQRAALSLLSSAPTQPWAPRQAYGKNLETREKPRNLMWREIMWLTAGIHEVPY